VVDHPDILSLGKTRWIPLYFLRLAPAKDQPLKCWRERESHPRLYNGDESRAADLFRDQTGYGETAHSTTQNDNVRF